MNWGKVGLFAGGVLFGTAGIKILTSRDAKKVYAFTTAAALRAKEARHDNRDEYPRERGRHSRRRKGAQREVCRGGRARDD